MNVEKMKAVFADEDFVRSLFEMENAAQVQEALQEKEIHLTEEEILGIRELFLKVESGEISAEQLEQWAVQAENGELSEEALEQVSGGAVVTFLICCAAIVVGTAAGAGATIGVIYGISSAVKNRW